MQVQTEDLASASQPSAHEELALPVWSSVCEEQRTGFIDVMTFEALPAQVSKTALRHIDMMLVILVVLMLVCVPEIVETTLILIAVVKAIATVVAMVAVVSVVVVRQLVCALR